jgi:SAM-dependent methyltransferase
MSRNARRAGKPLRLPKELLAALEALEGEPLDAGPAVRRIAAGVTRLNHGLTRARGGFAGYLRDPELRAAYRTYYLCTNAPKLFPVLDRLEARGLLPAGGGRALELGCGPGTGVAGLALWAAAHDQRWTLHATDVLREAAAGAAELMGALGVPATTGVVDLAAPVRVEGRWDLVLCMNVLNELDTRHDARLLEDLRGLLSPDGLWVAIEPASSAESRRVLALRDRAVAAGWQVVAPCPNALACPALAAADGWCHGEWHFERPAFVRAVDRETGLLREVLKATWFVLAPPDAQIPPVLGPDATGTLARVTTARNDAKGRSDLEVCVDGALRRLELQTRDRTPENADFFDLSRHDLAHLEGPGVSAGERRLSADDRVERVDETT